MQLTQLDLFADDDPAPAPLPKASTPALLPATPARPKPTTPRILPTPSSTSARPDLTGIAADSSWADNLAVKIAESVAHAWHTAHGGSNIAMPIGAVAALALVAQRDPDGPPLGEQIMSLSTDDLIPLLARIWSQHWMSYPHLVDRALPIHGWLEQDLAQNERYAVRQVVHAALRTGLLRLTGHHAPEDRAHADVLSHVIQMLRSHGARDGLGEFHTPPPIAETMAVITVMPPEPGDSILDPAAGSGGLMRAAAQVIRRHGMDPAEFTWAMVDIDPIAASCAATNAIVWGLTNGNGTNVTVACDDSLANARAVEDARKRAREVIEHRNSVVGTLRLATNVRRAQAFLARVA
ncbi:N-6 DNA methylase (plasmid) [Streptomyces sp. BI20]|uniref:N-6 DNA methylase n=1 Tax=Streptomyces sp. BI20 TaxID=3403460 RepID=UPI003C74BA29